MTVTSSGKLESARTAVDYAAEAATAAPDPSKALVINNSGTDLIVVYGIKAGDTVKVYNVASGGTVLATAKAATGATYVTITSVKLNSAGGDLYLTVTSSGQTESDRAKVTYSAE